MDQETITTLTVLSLWLGPGLIWGVLRFFYLYHKAKSYYIQKGKEEITRAELFEFACYQHYCPYMGDDWSPITNNIDDSSRFINGLFIGTIVSWMMVLTAIIALIINQIAKVLSFIGSGKVKLNKTNEKATTKSESLFD